MDVILGSTYFLGFYSALRPLVLPSTSCFLDDDDAGSFGSGERRTAVSIIDGQLWKPFPYFWTWGYAWWYHGGIMSVFLWYKRYQGGAMPLCLFRSGAHQKS
jgi:hypothetical protein